MFGDDSKCCTYHSEEGQNALKSKEDDGFFGLTVMGVVIDFPIVGNHAGPEQATPCVEVNNKPDMYAEIGGNDLWKDVILRKGADPLLPEHSERRTPDWRIVG